MSSKGARKSPVTCQRSPTLLPPPLLLSNAVVCSDSPAHPRQCRRHHCCCRLVYLHIRLIAAADCCGCSKHKHPLKATFVRTLLPLVATYQHFQLFQRMSAACGARGARAPTICSAVAICLQLSHLAADTVPPDAHTDLPLLLTRLLLQLYAAVTSPPLLMKVS